MGRVGEWLKSRVIIFCESVKIYKAFFAPYCLLFAYGMALSSPVSVIIRRILHAGGIQLFDHLIKRRFPNVLKPVCMSEPFYEGRTNCIVCADKCATIPSFSKDIVAKAAERPAFRAIVRAVDSSCNITAAGICHRSDSLRIWKIWNLKRWIKFFDFSIDLLQILNFDSSGFHIYRHWSTIGINHRRQRIRNDFAQ